ncbi:MAG: polysaccharide deacetylase family protein [Candidatus Hydrothermarchaeota archaeon]|nr:polysaccharide deacetylase family protein [Candidatus Hydrothermarchaeota archaeon]
MSRFIVLLLLISGCLTAGPGEEISIANWPNGYKSAIVATFDTEAASPQQLSDIAAVLSSKNANATFFVVAGYFQKNPHDLEVIKKYEVASLGWMQSNWANTTLSWEFQKSEIKRADEWLRSNGFTPAGFRAPFLRSDAATFKVLESLNYKYDSSQYHGFLPYRVGKIIEVPLSLNFDLYWDENVTGYSTLPVYIIFQKSYDEDALFTFYAHTKRVNENLQDFSHFINFAGARNVWLASAGEVAEWWAQREKLELRIKGSEITVKNNGDASVKGAAIKFKPKKKVAGAIATREYRDVLYAVLPEIPARGEVKVKIE